MLDNENLDIAIICTWGRYHASLSNQIAKSQKVRAILCEKPITQTAEECREMVACAKANNILLAEAFKFRHHPLHLKTKEILDSGKIGTLGNIRSTFCTGVSDDRRKPELNWRFNKEKGGGAVYDLGCYNTHHARFIANADPIRVYATGEFGREVDETIIAIYEFPIMSPHNSHLASKWPPHNILKSPAPMACCEQNAPGTTKTSLLSLRFTPATALKPMNLNPSFNS